MGPRELVEFTQQSMRLAWSPLGCLFRRNPWATKYAAGAEGRAAGLRSDGQLQEARGVSCRAPEPGQSVWADDSTTKANARARRASWRARGGGNKLWLRMTRAVSGCAGHVGGRRAERGSAARRAGR
eukprot:223585-Prymnesium_polylepis.1